MRRGTHQEGRHAGKDLDKHERVSTADFTSPARSPGERMTPGRSISFQPLHPGGACRGSERRPRPGPLT